MQSGYINSPYEFVFGDNPHIDVEWFRQCLNSRKPLHGTINTGFALEGFYAFPVSDSNGEFYVAFSIEPPYFAISEENGVIKVTSG